MTYNVTS